MMLRGIFLLSVQRCILRFHIGRYFSKNVAVTADSSVPYILTSKLIFTFPQGYNGESHITSNNLLCNHLVCYTKIKTKRKQKYCQIQCLYILACKYTRKVRSPLGKSDYLHLKDSFPF